MSEVKFTGGPWFVVGYGLMIRSSESGTEGDTICVFDHGNAVYKNHDANANLIAAAPEIYDVLKELAKSFGNVACTAHYRGTSTFCRGHFEDCINCAPWRECIEKANAVIAKAKGEQPPEEDKK